MCKTQTKKLKVVLSIAGSDWSGGAGIQADLKTMCAHKVYGMTAITAMTAQNTLGVTSIQPSTPEFLEDQIEACLCDIGCDAIKIGMLPNENLLFVIIKKLKEYDIKNVVLDPVMVSSSGRRLMEEDMVEIMAKELFPLCGVITPNIPETEVLWKKKITSEKEMEEAAKYLGETYGCGVLIKGGHFLNWREKKSDVTGEKPSDVNNATSSEVKDVLYEDGNIFWFSERRHANPNTHGTGCTLSSAIASNLALGYELPEAIQRAKSYLTRVIEENLDLGHGAGPMNHMISVENK
ncbi:MAG: bifunctional hydroxymethylpyrimidine kinase/phosphomethylpyrimidine kinase [Lachnospiraceae bacterium]|nr:bifunctional hydroxymethylpyrimidine kinase/phosphomethylpyrimidine kinase [Lachnospiraceae bacterium]